MKIDIENYPAVKQHLLSFGKKRLEQSGEKGSRKKTNNKWFETQDSISYWEDFNRQKIVWKRIGSTLRFSYDSSKIVTLDSTCFATGKYLKYIMGFLNSNVGNYLLQNSPKTGTGDLLISVQAINPIFVPIPNKDLNAKFEDIINHLLKNSSNKNQIKNLNNLIYTIFNFSREEINFIESQ